MHEPGLLPRQAECTSGWLLTVTTVLVKANPMAMQPQMRQPAAMTLALQAAPSGGACEANMGFEAENWIAAWGSRSPANSSVPSRSAQQQAAGPMRCVQQSLPVEVVTHQATNRCTDCLRWVAGWAAMASVPAGNWHRVKCLRPQVEQQWQHGLPSLPSVPGPARRPG